MIAKVENRKFYGHTIDKFGGDTGNELPEMRYHWDWHWLMPAWGELRKKVFEEYNNTYPDPFASMMDVFGLNCELVNIEACYKILVEAILWYTKSEITLND